MRLLWIIPRGPLPLNDGAKQASFQLISSLGRQGAIIDLLALALPEDLLTDTNFQEKLFNQFHIKSFHQIPRLRPSHTLRLWHLLIRPWMALTLSPFALDEVNLWIKEKLTKAQQAGAPYDAVVFDGLHCAAGVHFSLSEQIPFIYRAHNVEYHIWERKSDQYTGWHPLAFAKKLFFRWQSFMMRAFEYSLVSRCTHVFTVSENDQHTFEQWLESINADFNEQRGNQHLESPQTELIQSEVIKMGAPQIKTIPIGMSAIKNTVEHRTPSTLTPSESLDLLFIGKLDWPPNADGLRWFLTKVWPALIKTRPQVKLHIVGSGQSHWLSDLLNQMDINLTKNITFYGKVPAVEPFYEQADLCLVPIFYGSGTRVKAIEASLHGKPCLSTAVGIEGLPLTNDLETFTLETEQQWIDFLSDGSKCSKSRCKHIGHAACTRMKPLYDPDEIAKQFVSACRLKIPFQKRA